MSEERAPASRRATARPAARNDSKSEIPLDREHATAGLKRFLDLAISEMQLALEYSISSGESGASPSEAEIEVAFRGQDEELLLEHNAELLIALEHIAHRWLRLDPRMHDRVRFDCGDYRATRLEELKLSARVAAQRVRETGQPFRFNPMSSRERRIIHLELNGAAGVRTVSEDAGDRRHLVIYPLSRK